MVYCDTCGSETIRHSEFDYWCPCCKMLICFNCTP